MNEPYCYVSDWDFLSTGSSLQIININMRASPSLAGSLPLGGTLSGIVYKNGYVYIVAGDPGIYVIDVSNPATPSVAGTLIAVPATGAIAIDPVRDLLYLGTTDTVGYPNDGLKIIDISNPAAPKIVGTVDLPNWTVGLAYHDNHLFATTADIDPTPTDPSTFQIIMLSGF